MNPWLRIVAAHALHSDAQRTGAEEQRQLPRYVKDAIDLVSDQPDARALALHDAQATADLFWFPPSLHAGLERIT